MRFKYFTFLNKKLDGTTTTTIIFILLPHVSYAMIAYKNAGCKLSFAKYFKNPVNVIFLSEKVFLFG